MGVLHSAMLSFSPLNKTSIRCCFCFPFYLFRNLTGLEIPSRRRRSLDVFNENVTLSQIVYVDLADFPFLAELWVKPFTILFCQVAILYICKTDNNTRFSFLSLLFQRYIKPWYKYSYPGNVYHTRKPVQIVRLFFKLMKTTCWL